MSNNHMGRGWNGHAVEDGCPCPQEACGLVAEESVDPTCPEHPWVAQKSMRQSHTPDRCPAGGDS